jgi:glutamine cyclotransferase
MPGTAGPIWTVVGVSAAVLTTLAIVILVATLDPYSENKQPTKVHPAGGMEIVDTYKINNRYFFQGLEFIEQENSNKDLNLLYSEGWYGSSSLGVLKIN